MESGEREQIAARWTVGRDGVGIHDLDPQHGECNARLSLELVWEA